MIYYTGRRPDIHLDVDEARAHLAGEAPYYVLVVDRPYPGQATIVQQLAGDHVHALLSDTWGRKTTTLLANRPAE